jgi:hypothetical protein
MVGFDPDSIIDIRCGDEQRGEFVGHLANTASRVPQNRRVRAVNE